MKNEIQIKKNINPMFLHIPEMTVASFSKNPTTKTTYYNSFKNLLKLQKHFWVIKNL